MADPIDFLIIKNMQAALQAISKSAGYHHDISAVAVKLDKRHNVEERIPEANAPIGPPRPFIVLEVQTDDFEYHHSGQLLQSMPFSVLFVDDTDAQDDDARIKKHLTACADIETALTIDHQRGGKAIDTRLLGRELSDDDSSTVRTIVSGEVRLHRTYGAPNG